MRNGLQTLLTLMLLIGLFGACTEKKKDKTNMTWEERRQKRLEQIRKKNQGRNQTPPPPQERINRPPPPPPPRPFARVDNNKNTPPGRNLEVAKQELKEKLAQEKKRQFEKALADDKVQGEGLARENGMKKKSRTPNTTRKIVAEKGGKDTINERMGAQGDGASKQNSVATSVPRAPGFRYSVRDCNMRDKPSLKGGEISVIKKGRKLWTEMHNSDWVVVFRKGGKAYVHSQCMTKK